MSTQLTAGPVWVKAKDRLPENSNLVHINYCTKKTKFKTTGFYDKDRVWYDTQGYAISWPETIEWLDESEQQVFTRYVAERMLLDLARDIRAEKVSTLQDVIEWFNMNYPTSK